ncbi:MAG: YicC family protein [Synergistaceae bacterium]|jgi:uncharacterized protein (TIGR00255 family)|nr:YicC family protein [Synergistaceae bacterium]
MYISMTGFGSTHIEREWGTISLELSSVNHRYQEIFARFPRELSSWEPWFHQKLRRMFRRGKVQARVDIVWASSALAVSFNKEVLSAYYHELSKVSGELGQAGEISLYALLGLPGVIDTQERSWLSMDDDTEELLSQLLESGVENWQKMRLTEGSHLKNAVDEHLLHLERLISEISTKWQVARDAAFVSMKERIRRALDSISSVADDSRFAQEAVFIADRWDVTEEIARLASHTEKFREIGESQESSGRKLDFLIQEMNRELNTLNSKVADAGVRWLVVEAKTAIERVREQIQNLE